MAKQNTFLSMQRQSKGMKSFQLNEDPSPHQKKRKLSRVVFSFFLFRSMQNQSKRMNAFPPHEDPLPPQKKNRASDPMQNPQKEIKPLLPWRPVPASKRKESFFDFIFFCFSFFSASFFFFLYLLCSSWPPDVFSPVRIKWR